jgi:hypothetical protein
MCCCAVNPGHASVPSILGVARMRIINQTLQDKVHTLRPLLSVTAGADHASFQSFWHVKIHSLTALRQYRSDQRTYSKLSAVESPPEAETWFGLSSFSSDCGGTAAP